MSSIIIFNLLNQLFNFLLIHFYIKKNIKIKKNLNFNHQFLILRKFSSSKILS